MPSTPLVFRSRFARTAALLPAILLPAVPVPARAQCGPDQEQALTGSFVALVGPGPSTYAEAGQVFVPSVDGILETVHLFGALSPSIPGTGPLVVELRTVTGGLPDAGPPFLSHAVPFADVPTVATEFAVDVLADGAAVLSGTPYALTLRSDSGVFLWGTKGGDPYAPGTEVTRETRDGPWTASPNLDTFFRTSICRGVVPVAEPWAPTSWGRAKASYRREAR